MTDANGTGNKTGWTSPSGEHGSAGSIPKRPALNRRVRAKTTPPDPKRPDQKERRSRRSATRSSASRLDAVRGVGRSSKGSSKEGARKRIAKGGVVESASAKSTVLKPESKAGGKLVALKKPNQKPRRRTLRRKLPVPLLYFSRLAIVGLGVAVIGGTLLKALPNSEAQTAAVPVVEIPPRASANFPVELGQEIAPLKADMQELPNLYPDLTPKAFYIDVDSGNYVNLEGGDAIAAASTIKLPILLAFFEEVDQERISFNQTIEMLPEQIAEGSGDMQFTEPGTRFTALEVATQMIVTSDNTATNMMIDLLGGPIALNERFESYGLEKTQLNSALPDIEGTNKTSAKDLVRTMLLISGDRLSLRARDRILNILNRTRNKDLLASGMMQREALTYNKTGYIGSMLGDVALVDLSNGKRYVVAALVERPRNDNRATELIHRISDMTYKASDEAIQTSVTPLGDPNGAASPDVNSEVSGAVEPSPAVGTDAGRGVDITPVEVTPVEVTPTEDVIDEEPYPSANP